LHANPVPAAGAPPLSRLSIRVASPGHAPVIVRLTGSSVRLPIFLHLGLNRIRLTLVQRPTSPDELTLSDLNLTP